MAFSNRHPIIPLRLGTQTAYLVPAKDGFVMVDAGNRGCGRIFEAGLRRWRVDPAQIRLLILTHVHFDHAGSAAHIHRLTGCRVAVGASEAGLLATGRAVIPPGINWYGRVVSWLGRKRGTRHFDFDPVRPDLLIEDGLDLAKFGLAGRAVSTPGHTTGSVSLILDSGQAFVGDAAIRYLPFLPPLLPPFGYDRERLLKNWKELLETGISIFYPGHGWPFSAAELAARYDLLSRRGAGRGSR